MSIDIQKQLDLRPYNDKNVVSKPIEEPKQQATPPVDEEKSNAAKWMIGLTATAAIALGGLYAAKHGKLGESAEKWAKKLFGEGVKEATTAATSSAPATGAAGTAALALITPAFVRGKIKNPKFKFNDLIQELERAKISFEKTEATELIPKSKITALTENGSFTFKFDKDGVLKSIRKLTDDNDIVYRFENNILTGVKRKFTADNGKELQRIVEFTEKGKVKSQKFKFELDGKPVELESVPGSPRLYKNAGDATSEGEYIVEKLGKKFDELPKQLQDIRMNIGERVTTPRIERFGKYIDSLEKLKGVKTEELVEAFIPKTSKYFKQAVAELDVVRKQIDKIGNNNYISLEKVLGPYQFAEQFKPATYNCSELLKALSSRLKNKTDREIIKILQQDLKGIKEISSDNLVTMMKNYKSKLAQHKITNPDHVAIVAKPIKDCSYDELATIINEVAPGRMSGVISDPIDKAEEQKLVIKIIERLTGRKKIDENTSLLELLSDL